MHCKWTSEAREADIGIAFGKNKAAIFIRGKVIKRVETGRVLGEFKKELKDFLIKS